MPKRLTQEEFMIRAKRIYGSNYDFSKSEYRNFNFMVMVGCPIHGYFNVKAYSILRGEWICPKCLGIIKGERCYGNDRRKGKDRKRVSYLRWSAMMHRCYSCNDNRDPSYQNCSVCEEWQDYDNFRKWFSENYIDGYCLDKDVLIKGNNVYSPETCCFLPPAINIIFKDTPIKNRSLPKGVSKQQRGGYRAAVGKYGKIIGLGTYSTPEEAFKVYKREKEAYIKEVATEYYSRGEITKPVYDALMRWEVQITD